MFGLMIAGFENYVNTWIKTIEEKSPAGLSAQSLQPELRFRLLQSVEHWKYQASQVRSWCFSRLKTPINMMQTLGQTHRRWQQSPTCQMGPR